MTRGGATPPRARRLVPLGPWGLFDWGSVRFPALHTGQQPFHQKLRLFHLKLTCLRATNFGASCGANLVTLPPQILVHRSLARLGVCVFRIRRGTLSHARLRIPFSRFCRDPLYRGTCCDPKGSMVFLQNKFRCPHMLGARRT